MEQNIKIKLCVICGEKAKGFNLKSHFVSCLACKQFFYRNYANLNRYRCITNGNCSLDKASRKKCKRCRLEKCFAIGMKQSWATQGEKTQLNQNINKSTGIFKQTKLKIKIKQSTDLRNLLDQTITNQVISKQEISNYKTDCFDDLNNLDKNLDLISLTEFENKRISEVKEAISVFDNERELPEIGEAKEPADLVNIPELYIRNLIKFCKLLNGFNELSTPQQLAIMKQFFIEVHFVRNFFDWDEHRDGFYRLVNDNPKQVIFIPISKCFNFKNSESRKRFVQNKKIGFELRNLMDKDEVIRNLVLALLAFRQRNNVHLYTEYIRYNHSSYCHLLLRYLQHKYRDSNVANKRFSRIINLSYKMYHISANAHVFFDQEVDAKQIPHILLEILGL